MLRGEIRLVNFEPSLGSEANQYRPAIVVSNNAASQEATRRGRGVVAVVPLTSQTQRVYPFQVEIESTASGLDRDSKAQAEQVRSVSVERVGDRIGHVPLELMGAVDDALRRHLSL